MFNPTRSLGHTGGLRGWQPMTDSDLRAVAPSIFTEHKSPKMSDRYGFVPTYDIVQGLRSEGFMPVFAGVTRTRKVINPDGTYSVPADRAPYARHLIRFRQDGAVALRDGFPEIVLRNDHGGAGAYELFTGFFRVVCLNGLVACSGSLGSIRVRHSIRAVEGVVEAAWEVARGIDGLSAEIESFRAISLDSDRSLDFATRALSIRYPESGTAPVDPRALLRITRSEDAGPDLWSVFNRVQEHLVNGTKPSLGFVPPETDKGRPRRMRRVSGVHENVRVNRALWSLASEYAGNAPAAAAVVEI